MSQEAYIRDFSTLSSDDVDLVGGKNASLGEMYCNLTEQGIQIPEGFATTADAFWYYLRYNGIYDKIARTLDNIDTGNTRLLSQTGARIRSWILEGDMPPDLALQIRSAYQQMAEKYDLDVATNVVDPFYISPEAKIIQAALQATGLTQAQTVPFGTEAAVYKDYFQPVILGPGHINQAHTVGESIGIAELHQAVAVYQRLITLLCQ